MQTWNIDCQVIAEFLLQKILRGGQDLTRISPRKQIIFRAQQEIFVHKKFYYNSQNLKNGYANLVSCSLWTCNKSSFSFFFRQWSRCALVAPSARIEYRQKIKRRQKRRLVASPVLCCCAFLDLWRCVPCVPAVKRTQRGLVITIYWKPGLRIANGLLVVY